MLQHGTQDLHQDSVHIVLGKWKQSLHEPNVASPSRGDQDQVRIPPCHILRDYWKYCIIELITLKYIGWNMQRNLQ